MSTTLSSAWAKFALAGTESTTIGSSSRSMALAPIFTGNLSNGNSTAAAQANTVASIVGNVTNGTPVSIDLSNLTGAGVDDPLVLTNVKSIMIQNTSGSGGGSLTIGDSTGATANEFKNLFGGNANGSLTLEPGGAVGIHNPAAGMAVSSTDKVLLLTSSAGTVSYQIDLIGIK